jgi:hypothetical protein
MNIFGYELIKKEREIREYGKPIFSILVCEKGITLSGPNGEGKPEADPRLIVLANVLTEQFNNNWQRVCDRLQSIEDIEAYYVRSIEYNNAGYGDPFSQTLQELLKEPETLDNREVG